MFVHACDGDLDARGEARLLSAIDGPAQAVALMDRIGTDPERVGVARLIAGELDAPPPERIENPSSAVVFPIDTAVLGQVGRAYRLMFAAGHPLSDRQWAHAYLAKVHLHALQSLPQERTATPAQVWLAGRALHHARRALGNVHRSPKRIRPFIAGLEPDLVALHDRLDQTPHHGDPLLVAVERQRFRDERGEPLRVADIDRLTQQSFADQALEQALAQPAPDPWVELVIEYAESRQLRPRKLPEQVEAQSDGEGTTESTGDPPPPPQLPAGPSFADVQVQAEQLVATLEATKGEEATRIALADAAWVLRRRPDVAPVLSARRDALGELARRHLAHRGESTDPLEFESDPEDRRRIRFATTR